jgi:hypothetical protein
MVYFCRLFAILAQNGPKTAYLPSPIPDSHRRLAHDSWGPSRIANQLFSTAAPKTRNPVVSFGPSFFPWTQSPLPSNPRRRQRIGGAAAANRRRAAANRCGTTGQGARAAGRRPRGRQAGATSLELEQLRYVVSMGIPKFWILAPPLVLDHRIKRDLKLWFLIGKSCPRANLLAQFKWDSVLVKGICGKTPPILQSPLSRPGSWPKAYLCWEITLSRHRRKNIEWEGEGSSLLFHRIYMYICCVSPPTSHSPPFTEEGEVWCCPSNFLDASLS